MQAVTITQITPPELESLIENSLRKILSTKQAEPPSEIDRWFDLNELCIYRPDKPAKATVYGEVHKGIIPVHKRAKKLMFLKSEVDIWLKTGRKRTIAEIESEADNYLQTKKRLNNGK
jgi:hypothetical protein